MITFFRKIRKGLLASGATRKYVLYAIGEIALVVIGILIAVQINNWNEWRKDRVQEKIVLEDLAKNLEINVQTLQEDIEFLSQKNLSGEIVIDALENRIDYTDNLKVHFHEARVTKQELFLSNIGYQALKDKGMRIVTNKPLSDEIINLFEVTMPSLLSTNNLVNTGYDPFVNHVVQQFIFMDGEGLTPNDYKSLFTDHFYISWIRAYKEGRIYLMETDKRLIEECERVLQLIKDELQSDDGSR